MASINFNQEKNVEWADLEVAIDGAGVTKLEGIRFKVSRDLAHLFGEGDEALDIQAGNKTRTGQIKLLVGSVDKMNLAAIAAGADDLTDIEWAFTLHWKPRGNRAPKFVTLTGVRISEFEEGMDQGDKQMVVTMPFLFLSAK